MTCSSTAWFVKYRLSSLSEAVFAPSDEMLFTEPVVPESRPVSPSGDSHVYLSVLISNSFSEDTEVKAGSVFISPTRSFNLKKFGP
jgi:hypothetical protein